MLDHGLIGWGWKVFFFYKSKILVIHTVNFFLNTYENLRDEFIGVLLLLLLVSSESPEIDKTRLKARYKKISASNIKELLGILKKIMTQSFNKNLRRTPRSSSWVFWQWTKPWGKKKGKLKLIKLFLKTETKFLYAHVLLRSLQKKTMYIPTYKYFVSKTYKMNHVKVLKVANQS